MTLYNILNRESAQTIHANGDLLIIVDECIKLFVYDELLCEIEFDEMTAYIYSKMKGLFREIGYKDEGIEDIDPRYYESLDTRFYPDISPIINYYLDQLQMKGIVC